MNTFKEVAITPASRNWLRAARPSRVLSVFTDVLNLVNDHDQVLSLVSRFEDMGPFSVQIIFPEMEIRSKVDFCRLVGTDSPVMVGKHRLAAGSLRARLDTGESWDPELKWPERGVERYTREIDLLKQLVVDMAPPESLVSPILKDQYWAPHHERAQSIWISIHRSLQLTPVDRQQAPYAELAGLGTGLTPAGDDFLIGLIFSLRWHLGKEQGAQASFEIADAARPRTNTLSRAWLEAAGRLEAANYWHRLFQAIYSRSDAEIGREVRQFLNLGHTSGADALAGFLAFR